MYVYVHVYPHMLINPHLCSGRVIIIITFSLIEKYLLLSPKNQKVATTYIQNRNMIRLHKNNKYKTYTDNNVYSGLLHNHIICFVFTRA